MTRIFFELDQLNYLQSILAAHEPTEINRKLLTKFQRGINRIKKLLSTP